MQRVTVTIDDELMDALDHYMEAGGHQNRSEAVRDLIRAGLVKEVDGNEKSRSCVAALVYVYDHETRQLAKKLIQEHHAHADMSVATMHVHIDEVSCLEISVLKGPQPLVERFANRVIGERGVRYGQLVTVPIDHEERHEGAMLLAG